MFAKRNLLASWTSSADGALMDAILSRLPRMIAPVRCHFHHHNHQRRMYISHSNSLEIKRLFAVQGEKTKPPA
jgi:hypothetical protein